MQPYVLKPNGNVFDEIRNFFIDGEWAYSVYTDGVDYEGFWEQPEGKLKEACKKCLRCRRTQENRLFFSMMFETTHMNII